MRVSRGFAECCVERTEQGGPAEGQKRCSPTDRRESRAEPVTPHWLLTSGEMYRGEGKRLQESRQNRRLWWVLSLKDTQTHTLRHSGLPWLAGATSLLANLLTLASLMVVNAFSWTLPTALYHLAFTSLCGRSLSSSLCKPDADSHALTCMHSRPGIQNKEQRTDNNTHRGDFSLSSGRHYSTISLDSQ